MKITKEVTEWGIVYYYKDKGYKFVLYFYDDDPLIAYLSSVYVSPRLRHKGIGNTILQTAEKEALKCGVKKICLRCDKTLWVHDWYKRYGYKDIGDDELPNYIWMQKPLKQNLTNEEIKKYGL